MIRFELQVVADIHRAALYDAQATSKTFWGCLVSLLYICGLGPGTNTLSTEQGWLGAEQVLVCIACALSAVGCLGISVGLSTVRKVTSLKAAKWPSRIKHFSVKINTYWWKILLLFFLCGPRTKLWGTIASLWPCSKGNCSSSWVVHNNFIQILLIMIKCWVLTQVFQMLPVYLFLFFNVALLHYYQKIASLINLKIV